MSKSLHVRVESQLTGDVWNSDVYIDHDWVGGGTSPHGPLDIASDILYGTKDDWLNGGEGALKEALNGRG